jgi:hypothetical protein
MGAPSTRRGLMEQWIQMLALVEPVWLSDRLGRPAVGRAVGRALTGHATRARPRQVYGNALYRTPVSGQRSGRQAWLEADRQVEGAEHVQPLARHPRFRARELEALHVLQEILQGHPGLQPRE